MTAKAVTQTSPETSQATPPKRRSFRPLAWLGGLLFRLILLGLGGGAAAALGILIALLGQPREVTETPWVVQAWQRLQAPTATPTPAPPTPSPSPTAAPSPPPGTVTADQRATLQEQVEALNQQLNDILATTSTLEQELGLAADAPTDEPTDEPTNEQTPEPTDEQTLSARLQALNQAVQNLPEAPEPEPPAPPPLAANTEIQLGSKLRSPYDLDSIFDTEGQISEQGERQLFHLVQELASYPGSTVRIGVHLDSQNDPETSRQLSFQLARSLERYLRDALNNSDNYTWVPLGFGSSRPLVANDSDANRQRNRRVEIGVD